MIPDEVILEASEMGYVTAEELRLRSGKTVYLLVPEDGAIVGLPQYLHYVDGVLVQSNAKESMALLDEPDYIGGEDA